ncbi:EAL domain-containing protein [Vibrio makurazakiensis]|uniref:hypothetical protein n=1 Tax=Vibrio makurazakiensis TaxID=2910250 RepID=UPI003D0A3E5A
MCVLFSNKYKESHKLNNFTQYKCQYKYQEIRRVNPQSGRMIGVEVLLDNNILSELRKDGVINYYLQRSHVSRELVARLYSSVINNKDNTMFDKEYIFINLERSHLCDLFLIGDIITLHDALKGINTKLVVEITERNNCLDCSKIREGIEILNKNKIILAVDDYDIYSEVEPDFRLSEYNAGLYELVKIRAPKNLKELTVFYVFCKSSPLKIIVEQIESEDDANLMIALDLIWGMQGFHFHKGTPADL